MIEGTFNLDQLVEHYNESEEEILDALEVAGIEPLSNLEGEERWSGEAIKVLDAAMRSPYPLVRGVSLGGEVRIEGPRS